MNRNRVNVIGIGAQKCASSWVFQVLKSHPEILTASRPNPKELNFFNFEFVKGYDWYHRYFDFDGRQAVEFSVRYFTEPSVPGRLYDYDSDLKILVCIRDPVERAYSQHKHEFQQNRLSPKRHDFNKALEQNPTYIEQGKYATHLKRYLEYFSKNQIHLILHREIQNHPEQVTRDLYDFIGVNPDHDPEALHERENVSYGYRSHRIKTLVRKSSKQLHKIAPELVKLLKKTGLPSLIRGWNRTSIESGQLPELDYETEQRMAREFKPEREQLEQIFDLDLTHWT